MSYTTVVAGVVSALQGVSGLTTVLDYEPNAIQGFPTCYILFDSAEGVSVGAVRGMRYRMLLRLCLRWQDNEQAETELMPFVNSIPDALAADVHLGGALTSGAVLMDTLDAQGGFVKIGGVVVRVVDFYLEVLEK